MRLLKHIRLPAYLALFVALGGSAYAASGPTILIFANRTSDSSVSVGSLGPWTFRLLCKKLPNSSGGYATLKITGRGNAGGTHTVGDGFYAANTFVAPLQPIGTGYVTIADTNQQVSATLFLLYGSNKAQVQVLISDDASDADAPQNCHVIGSATLITP